MSHPSPSLAALALFAACALSAAPHARGGVLYKCEAKGGVIAYTNKQDGYTKCSVLSRYADTTPPTPRRVEAVAPTAIVGPSTHSGARTVTTHGWVYEENAKVPPPRADFSLVDASAASSAAMPTPVSVIAAKRPLPVAQATASAAKILRGSVYRVQRKDGITEYTNVKPAGSAFAVLFTYIATCVACDVHSRINFASTALNLDAYRSEIAAAAADFGVDTSLLRAVIHAESAFNPLAVSNKGAQGLMQLMPATAGDLGVTDAFDVVQNIRGGARYLAQLMKDFGGDARLATAAYNAGAGAVQKYRGIPPYDETQVYVERVATLRDRYRKAL